MPPGRPVDPCTMMRNAIKSMKSEIPRKREQLKNMQAHLSKLQSQANPDPALIDQLKELIKSQEHDLVTTEAQLNAFEEEVSASCPPV